MASPKLILWGQCPLSPPSLPGAGGNRERLRTAQSRALITALTVMSALAVPRAPSVTSLSDTSGWTEQEGVFSHTIWEMHKHKQSPLAEASPSTTTKVRNHHLLLSVQNAQISLRIYTIYGWAQSQAHRASQRYKPHQLSGKTVRQNIP